MLLDEYLNMDKLREHVANGNVFINEHKCLPLSILSYTRKAVYDHEWDETLSKCRGLIFADDTGEIISRPFEKFWELSQNPDFVVPETDPVVMEKLNGSLGILWTYTDKDGTHQGIATKGSFHSDHAEFATEWYRKNVPHAVWPKGFTVLFEIICQEIQPHAVKYEKDGLRLLALKHNNTGIELDYNNLYHWAKINGLEVPKVYAKTFAECLADAKYTGEFRNQEGYVLSWPLHDLKLKVKFDDFKVQRKLLNTMTLKNVLEWMKTRTYVEMTKNLPEDLRTQAREYFDTIMLWFEEIWYQAVGFQDQHPLSRKELAEALKGHPLKAVVFARVDEATDKVVDSIYDVIEHYVSKGSLKPGVTWTQLYHKS